MLIRIPRRGYVLRPGRVYLGHTMERIGSEHFVTSLIGRSSSCFRRATWEALAAFLGRVGRGKQRFG